MFDNLKQDYQQFRGASSNSRATLFRILRAAIVGRGFRAVFLFRVGYWCRRRGLRNLAAVVERFIFHLCHCEISTNAKIGPGFVIRHPSGVVVGSAVEIGDDCEVRQGVTFGGSGWKTRADGRHQPLVGDRVNFGAGAKVLGPVEIGSDTTVGANSVVVADIPPNSIAAGVPARVIKCDDQKVEILEQSGELSSLLSEFQARIETLEAKCFPSGTSDDGG